MNRCKICGSQNLESLYRVDDLPLFQNKVYNSFAEAKSQKVVSVDLCQCQECRFVFNDLFTNENMDYAGSNINFYSLEKIINEKEKND